MLKKKTIAVWFVLVVSALFVFAGCSGETSNEPDNGGGEGNGEEQGENATETKTIEFMHLWPEGNAKDHYEIVNEIVAAYEEEHSNVQVEVQNMGNEQYKEKIKVLSSSDQLPDVGMTWSEGYLTPYVEGELFAPLNDVMEGGLYDQFVSGTVEAYSVDGNNYALPLELNIAPIFYNTSIFEEYGLEVPKTYEDFENVVQTLKDNGVTPIALGAKDGWTGSLWYMNLANRMAGEDVITKAVDGELSFDDPELVEPAEKIQELVDMGAFSEGAIAISDQEAKSQFINEQAAMYSIGTWDLPNYTTSDEVPQEFQDSVGFFNFPTVNGKGDMKNWVGGPGVGMFVAENSDVKEEAKAFAAFFAKQWGEKSVLQAGVIPATKVDPGALDLPEMYVDALNELNSAKNITVFADVQLDPHPSDRHHELMKSLFGKEITPEEFGAQQQAAIDQANEQ